MKIDYKKLAGVLLCILIALVSFLYSGNEDSAFANNTQKMLDERIDDALILSSASAISSVAVTLLPGDVATPVANKISDLTGYFIVASLFLYTEKFLLTILGYALFKVLIPIACGIYAVTLYKENEELKRITSRVVLFSLMVFVSIPVSAKISDMVYSRYAVDIGTVVKASTTVTTSEEGGEKTTGILDIVSEKISGVTASFTNRVGELFRSFIDIISVTIVSSCVIPLLVLAILLWLLNKLFGLKVFFPRGKIKKPLQDQQSKKE